MKRNTVKIAGIPYKVKVCATWKDVDHSDLAEKLHAEIDYLAHSIHVRGDAPPELMSRAFMHEVIHGIVAGYHVKPMEDEETGGHNEDAVDQIAVGLCEALESIGIEVWKHIPGVKK